MPTSAASLPVVGIPNLICGLVPVRVSVAGGAAIVPLAFAAALVTVLIVLQEKPVAVQSVGRISSVITSRFCTPSQVKKGVAVLKLKLIQPVAIEIVSVVD